MDKELVRGRWPGIFRNLGIEVGGGKHRSCPVCGGRDRFRFIDENGTGSFYCNQCQPHSGDGWALLMKVMKVDFKEAVRIVSGIIGEVTPEPINDSKIYNPEILREMYKKSSSLSGRCLGCLYLKNRGLKTFPKTLRFLPSCYEPSTQKKMPAILATFVDQEGEAITLHRIYLKPGGFKADLEHCKLTMTPKKPMSGGAVRLFEVEDGQIGIAEGIETALAVYELYELPVWATLNTTLMAGFKPPKGVKKIHIFADCDKNYAGEKAAYILAHRLVLDNYSVTVNIPEKRGVDFLDVLNEKKVNPVLK